MQKQRVVPIFFVSSSSKIYIVRVMWKRFRAQGCRCAETICASASPSFDARDMTKVISEQNLSMACFFRTKKNYTHTKPKQLGNCGKELRFPSFPCWNHHFSSPFGKERQKTVKIKLKNTFKSYTYTHTEGAGFATSHARAPSIRYQEKQTEKQSSQTTNFV